jgi:hypothetical protein
VSGHDEAHFGPNSMNAMADVEIAGRYARAIEDSEARRLGVRIPMARRNLADRIGVSPGTLRNLRKFNIKAVPAWLMARIRAEFVAILQTEIAKLEHEITIARQTGADYRDDDLAAAQAQVVAARALLNGSVR